MIGLIPVSIIDAIAERNCENESNWSCAKESAKAHIRTTDKVERKIMRNTWEKYKHTGYTDAILIY